MISFRGVTKTFADAERRHLALNEVGFDVPQGSVYVLLGPSGCGKTTLLRCLAGIETPDSGEIEVDGEAVFSSSRGVMVPAHRRGFGFVFQSYAIWPHMNVFENVAYPLRFGQGQRVSRDELGRRVLAALDMVGLKQYAERSATRLSGGQQQRVALARAVVHEPRVLLMDEPLSNLDAQLRAQTRKQLAELLGKLGTTTVYVTHDQIEAMALADVVAVMHDGMIQQSASPRELYYRPATRFIADFMGDMNWLEATIRGSEGDHVVVDTALGQLRCVTNGERRPGTPVTVGIRPLAVRLLDAAGNGSNGRVNVFNGELTETMFLGDATALTVRVGDNVVEVLTPDAQPHQPQLGLYLPPDSCVIYDR
ncbi:MAG TPA: ABC transporter ATP-binding protein [Solirubrobacteraceae bacterium]|jgi:iron(III) transport system ATP-binding protein|nr:ABC transporter ATP-binding protein [Solirubrobacteraceae bacterium]